MQPTRGRGTWVHPDIAIKLAAWLSVDFEVAVCALVREFLSGKVTTAQSQAASEQVTQVVQQQQPPELMLLNEDQKKNLADTWLQQQQRKLDNEVQISQFDTSLHMLRQCEEHNIWKFDCNLKMALVDNVKNCALPPGPVLTITAAAAADDGAEELQGARAYTAAQPYVTLAGWLAVHHPHNVIAQSSKFTTGFGKYVAAKYRETHDGRSTPHKVVKAVNHEMREVNAYDSQADHAFITACFTAFTAA